MMPVLYSPTETDFNTNGLGRLPDAISCVVTEERNGIFELEMEYPVDGRHFREIRTDSIIKAQSSPDRPDQLFRVYKIAKPMNRRVRIYAEHISYWLNFIPINAFEASNCVDAINGIAPHVMSGVACPFTFQTDKRTSQGHYQQIEPASIRSRLAGVEGSILDIYKGEYEWDNFNVVLHDQRGRDRGVVIRYGKNLTDVNQEESLENTMTGVVGWWELADEEGVNHIVALDAPVYCQNHADFPYERIEMHDFTPDFDEEPTKEQLLARAQEYVNQNDFGVPSVNLDVSFVLLGQTEEYAYLKNLETVSLCDTVRVQFDEIGVSSSGKVTKVEFDTLNERYVKIHIGEMVSDISWIIR